MTYLALEYMFPRQTEDLSTLFTRYINGSDDHYFSVDKIFKTERFGNFNLKSLKTNIGNLAEYVKSVIPKANRVTIQKGATKTGPSVLTKAGYMRVFEHANSTVGMLHAMFKRQLDTLLQPSDHTL
jgi:hypothetical protein